MIELTDADLRRIGAEMMTAAELANQGNPLPYRLYRAGFAAGIERAAKVCDGLDEQTDCVVMAARLIRALNAVELHPQQP